MAVLLTESADETMLLRRGEKIALERINHLKAQALAHERQIEHLTEALTTQSDILRDTAAYVASIVAALPKTMEPGSPVLLPHDSVSALLRLNQRLQRGSAARAQEPFNNPRAGPRGLAKV